jgi:hypothetical protein
MSKFLNEIEDEDEPKLGKLCEELKQKTNEKNY